MMQDWTKEINELERFFNRTELPPVLKLSEQENITHISTFITSHLNICRAYNGNEFYLPYLQRLIKVRELLINAGNSY